MTAAQVAYYLPWFLAEGGIYAAQPHSGLVFNTEPCYGVHLLPKAAHAIYDIC